MRTYVYACSVKEHPRKEVIHELGTDPVITCDVCGKQMHRVPQPMIGFYMHPEEVLISWMDDNYRRLRSKRPLNSPDLVKRPEKPIPNRDFNYRRRKVTNANQ